MIVMVKRRKKKLIKDFTDLKLPLEQKVTVFTVPLSCEGEDNKDNEEEKK